MYVQVYDEQLITFKLGVRLAMQLIREVRMQMQMQLQTKLYQWNQKTN